MRYVIFAPLLILLGTVTTALAGHCKDKCWKNPPRAPIVGSRAIREVARPVDRDQDRDQEDRVDELDERLTKLEKDVEKTLNLLIQMVQTLNLKTSSQPSAPPPLPGH